MAVGGAPDCQLTEDRRQGPLMAGLDGAVEGAVGVPHTAQALLALGS